MVLICRNETQDDQVTPLEGKQTTIKERMSKNQLPLTNKK